VYRNERDTGMLHRLATLLEEVLGMRKTALPLAAMVAALLASMLALATTEDPARAAFPGANGKIAFLSDRDGEEELYVKNADGTGTLQRVTMTKNTTRDVEPDWKPVTVR
jgi:hypothetical protein